MCRIINGREISERVYLEIKNELHDLTRNGQSFPIVLAVVNIGNDKASKIYVNCKKKACEKLGIKLEEHIFDSSVEETEVINCIESLNKNESITGILVQLPLPSHFCQEKILSAIDENKDIDALNPVNLGKLVFPTYDKKKDFAPCTALAILEILKQKKIDLLGKHVIVIGKSNIVGKPLALMLSHKKATVTLCDSKTENLPFFCKNSDIIISAAGVKNLINKNMVNNKSIIIDAGIVKNDDDKICGDINFVEVAPIVRAITPVPGGVGPVTVAIMIKNLHIAAKNKRAIHGTFDVRST